jgi:hypothetical protein
MVRTLNVTLDDSDFEQVEHVKDELGLTWQEFVIQSADALAQREDLE